MDKFELAGKYVENLGISNFRFWESGEIFLVIKNAYIEGYTKGELDNGTAAGKNVEKEGSRKAVKNAVQNDGNNQG